METEIMMSFLQLGPARSNEILYRRVNNLVIPERYPDSLKFAPIRIIQRVLSKLRWCCNNDHPYIIRYNNKISTYYRDYIDAIGIRKVIYLKKGISNVEYICKTRGLDMQNIHYIKTIDEKGISSEYINNVLCIYIDIKTEHELQLFKRLYLPYVSIAILSGLCDDLDIYKPKKQPMISIVIDPTSEEPEAIEVDSIEEFYNTTTLTSKEYILK